MLEIFFWFFAFSLTAIFFFNSWNGRKSLIDWGILVFEALLLALALISAHFSLKDRKNNFLKRKKRKKLQSVLFHQRKILGNRFDLKNKLGDLPLSGDSESLNLAKEETFFDPKEEEIEIAELNLDWEQKQEEEKLNLSEVNLAGKLLQGEDISGFPPEWRRFFLENEDLTTVEKLNRLLSEEESPKK